MSVAILANERQFRHCDANNFKRETDRDALTASPLREKELLGELSVLSQQQAAAHRLLHSMTSGGTRQQALTETRNLSHEGNSNDKSLLASR